MFGSDELIRTIRIKGEFHGIITVLTVEEYDATIRCKNDIFFFLHVCIIFMRDVFPNIFHPHSKKSWDTLLNIKQSVIADHQCDVHVTLL